MYFLYKIKKLYKKYSEGLVKKKHSSLFYIPLYILYTGEFESWQAVNLTYYKICTRYKRMCAYPHIQV